MKSLSEHILEHMSRAVGNSDESFANTAQSTNVETVQESTENKTSTQEVNENKEEESED